MGAFRRARCQLEILDRVERFSFGGAGLLKRSPRRQYGGENENGKTQALAWFFTAVSN